MEKNDWHRASRFYTASDDEDSDYPETEYHPEVSRSTSLKNILVGACLYSSFKS
jgi:hypothetical protein